MLRTKSQLFSSGFGDQKTIYMGNSTAADEAWYKLYPRTVVRIPKSSADQLVNKTIPIAGDEDHFPVLISVFHELHCLDSIRHLYFGHTKGFDKDPVINKAVLSPGHIDHCFDSLRQTIMCGGDISPVPYQWVPSAQKALGSLGVQHTCRGRAYSHTKLLPFSMGLRSPGYCFRSGRLAFIFILSALETAPKLYIFFRNFSFIQR